MLLLQIHHERRRSPHFLIGATIALHAGRYFYFMFIKMYHVLLFYYLCFTFIIYVSLPLKTNLQNFVSCPTIFLITLQRYGVCKRKIFHPNICVLFNTKNHSKTSNKLIDRDKNVSARI